jgi:hypothetical protein
MVQINRSVVIAAGGITAIGVSNAWLNKKPITPIIMGGYLLALALALFDLLGGGASQIAGALAWLALTAVVLTNLDLWQAVFSFVNGKPTAGSNGGGGGHPTAH